MGRLIDADKLIEELKSLQVFVTGLRARKGILSEYAKQYRESLLRVVDEQPTAYDVGKVVEQLEQQASQYKRRALELVEKSTEAGIHNKGKALSYEHAIEIVRKGGVENGKV